MIKNNIYLILHKERMCLLYRMILLFLRRVQKNKQCFIYIVSLTAQKHSNKNDIPVYIHHLKFLKHLSIQIVVIKNI